LAFVLAAVKNHVIWKGMISGKEMTEGITEITAGRVIGTITAIFLLTLFFRKCWYSLQKAQVNKNIPAL
jgi:hypothetical protein